LKKEKDECMAQASRDQNRIIEQAMRDENFRRRLLQNPEQALRETLGMSVPQGVKIHVYEDTPQDVHIVLPPAPTGGMQELSDADLETAVGGMRPINPTGTGCCTCGDSSNQTGKSLQRGCGC
jgi:hypothetical protein